MRSPKRGQCSTHRLSMADCRGRQSGGATISAAVVVVLDGLFLVLFL